MQMKFVKYLIDITNYTSKALVYVGAFFLLIMMLLTTVDVMGRYLFNHPILGVFELTKFMMVFIVFWSLAYTELKKGHVRVDIFTSRLSQKWQKYINIFNYLLSFIIWGLIAWKSAERGFELIANKECSGTLQIPIYPFLFVVLIGSVILCLEFLKDILNVFLLYKEPTGVE